MLVRKTSTNIQLLCLLLRNLFIPIKIFLKNLEEYPYLYLGSCRRGRNMYRRYWGWPDSTKRTRTIDLIIGASTQWCRRTLLIWHRRNSVRGGCASFSWDYVWRKSLRYPKACSSRKHCSWMSNIRRTQTSCTNMRSRWWCRWVL